MHVSGRVWFHARLAQLIWLLKFSRPYACMLIRAFDLFTLPLINQCTGAGICASCFFPCLFVLLTKVEHTERDIGNWRKSFGEKPQYFLKLHCKLYSVLYCLAFRPRWFSAWSCLYRRWLLTWIIQVKSNPSPMAPTNSQNIVTKNKT